jgi:hypothetical protein
MVDSAALISGSSFFLSAVLNEFVHAGCLSELFYLVILDRYGDFMLPGTISFHTYIEFCDFVSAHPLLSPSKSLFSESLERAYARDCNGSTLCPS